MMPPNKNSGTYFALMVYTDFYGSRTWDDP